MNTFKIVTTTPEIIFFESEKDGLAYADKHDVIALEYAVDCLSGLSGGTLVEIYNRFAEALIVPMVNRFATKGAAVERVMKIMDQAWQEGVGKRVAVKKAAAKKATVKAAKPTTSRSAFVPNGIGTINLKPKSTVSPVRANTKRAILVDYLSQEAGVTAQELSDALGAGKKPWSPATIKSGLTWDMNHEKGYGIKTEYHTGYERWCAGDMVTLYSFPAPNKHPDEYSEAERLELFKKAMDAGYVPEDDRHAVYKLVLPEGVKEVPAHIPAKKAGGEE